MIVFLNPIAKQTCKQTEGRARDRPDMADPSPATAGSKSFPGTGITGHAFTTMRSILNGLTASTEWGILAGMTTISPF